MDNKMTAEQALEYVQRYFDKQAIDYMDDQLEIIRAHLTDHGYVRVHQSKLTGDSEPTWRDASEELYCLTEEHKRRVVYIAATKETSHG